MSGESCNHLDEMLGEEIIWLKDKIMNNGKKVTNEEVMRYVKQNSAEYRRRYCGKECIYRFDCDLSKQFSEED